MNPEQQTTKQNASYDFILDTAQEPEKKPFRERINKKAVVIAVAILLLAITIGLISWFDAQSKAAEDQVNRLVSIAQLQTEISRTSNIGIEKAQKDDTRERSQAIKSNIDDGLKETLSLLSDRGATPDRKILSKLEDKSIDSALEKTVEFGKFDKSFEKIIDAQILDYQRTLLEAIENGNLNERQVLQKLYDQANAMLGLTDESNNNSEESSGDEQNNDQPEGEESTDDTQQSDFSEEDEAGAEE